MGEPNAPCTDGEPPHLEAPSPTPSDKSPSQSSPTTTVIPTHTTETKSTQPCCALDSRTKEAKTLAKETLAVHSSATDPSVESFHGESDVLKPNTQVCTPVSLTTSTGSTPTPTKFKKLLF